VDIVSVEWSVGKDSDLMVEVWNTTSLLEAVLGALLEEPDAMAKALTILGRTA
jgi:hypothetical protein